MMTVGVFLRIDASVILTGDVYTTDHFRILAEMNGCHVTNWFVGN